MSEQQKAARCLAARGVSKAYGKKQVLQGLDLTLEPGRIYGLIGRNGAGKTTLLGILTGQNTLDSGSVCYGDAPVWENPAALADICFSRELSPNLLMGQNTLKVRDYLRAARVYYPHWDEEYARRLIAEFGLEEKSKIYKLSKGMLSMVTIVLALASRAPLTILDEPVAGLDVVARQRFYQLLLEDQMATGRSFVVSTHIIEEAAAVFEEVILLSEGRIIEKCPTDELVSQFTCVSGREDVVNALCQKAGAVPLEAGTMGRQKAVTLRAERAGLERLAAAEGLDLDFAALNLQKVFVALCGHDHPAQQPQQKGA